MNVVYRLLIMCSNIYNLDHKVTGDSGSCMSLRLFLKWIFLQSAFIKSLSIKEQRPLILITEDRKGSRLSHTHRRPEASQHLRLQEDEEETGETGGHVGDRRR